MVFISALRPSLLASLWAPSVCLCMCVYWFQNNFCPERNGLFFQTLILRVGTSVPVDICFTHSTTANGVPQWEIRTLQGGGLNIANCISFKEESTANTQSLGFNSQKVISQFIVTFIIFAFTCSFSQVLLRQCFICRTRVQHYVKQMTNRGSTWTNTINNN